MDYSPSAPQGADAPVLVLPSDHVRIEKLRLWECLEVGELFDWDAVYEGLPDLNTSPSWAVERDPEGKSRLFFAGPPGIDGR